MTGEPALKHTSPSRLTRQLLASAKADVSAHGALQRALSGLGFAPVGLLAGATVTTLSQSASAATTTAAGSTTASQLGVIAALKWIGIGLLGSIAVLSTVELTSSPTVPRPSKIATVASAGSLPKSATGGAASATEPAVESGPTSAEPSPTHRRALSAGMNAPIGARETEPNRPAPAPAAGAFDLATDGHYVTELAALAGVRRSLAAHQARTALTLLDEFARLHPTSALTEEALVLRVEALYELGRAREASDLGASFLKSYPRSVYAARVRAALGIP